MLEWKCLCALLRRCVQISDNCGCLPDAGAIDEYVSRVESCQAAQKCSFSESWLLMTALRF